MRAGTHLAMSLEEWEWWPELSCDALGLVDVLAGTNRAPAQFVVLMHAARYLRVEHVETAVKEARWLRAQTIPPCWPGARGWTCPPPPLHSLPAGPGHRGAAGNRSVWLCGPLYRFCQFPCGSGNDQA